jgi:hypothetical protein
MPAFDAYDYVGYIVPGAVLLVGLMLLFPAIKEQLAGHKFELSDLGLLIILSFALGQMLHQVGHVVDKTKFVRTHYSDDILCGGDPSLSAEEKTKVIKIIESQYGFTPSCITEDTKTNWRNTVRQIYIEVHEAKRSERVDIFDRGVGLLLGLGTAFAVLFGICLVVALGLHKRVKGFDRIRSTLHGHHDDATKSIVVLVALAGASWLCFCRMEYFAKYYATELFLAYLLQHAPSPQL